MRSLETFLLAPVKNSVIDNHFRALKIKSVMRYALATAVLVSSLFAGAASAQVATAPIVGSHPLEAASLGWHASANSPLSIHISFALRNREALTQLLAEQQDRASAQYHRWLTPAEFNARFGRTTAEVAAMRDWLSHSGFRITGSNAREITATGNTAQAEGAFATKIASSGDGGAFGNTSDVKIPPQFSGMVASVDGLDNLRHSFALAKAVKNLRRVSLRVARETSALSTSALAKTRPGRIMRTVVSTPNFDSGSGLAFGPGDLATFYDQIPLISGGTTGGGGDCLAFIEDSDYLGAAVTKFDTTFGLPTPNLTRVLADGTSPGRTGDEIEVLLDIEWGHAAARGAALSVYIGNPRHFTIDPLADAIKKAVTDNRCGAISISYGYCGTTNSFFTGTLDPLFAQAAAQGQSVFVSSGDQGAAGIVLSGNTCVAGTSPNVSEMSADPNVTAVGGTQFTPNYSGTNDVGNVPESAWDDPSGSTGGGASTIFPKPAYQNTVTPADGMRDVPDIALGASPFFPGFYWANASGSSAAMSCCIGGTSIAAPIWAGLAKLVAQTDGGRLGNMNPEIYTLGAMANPALSGLRDVTAGNNTFNGVTGFSAVAGYDQATGWGTADMATFVLAYSGGVTPTPIPVMGPMVTRPKGIAYGLHKVATTSKPRIVTVVNPLRNKRSLTLGTITTSGGQFTIDPTTTTCVNGAILAMGARCKVGIIFNPSMTGVQTDTLTIGSNASNQPRIVVLQGIGR